MSEIVTAIIRTDEEPPRMLVKADTGECPTIKYVPGQERTTGERAVQLFSQAVLGRTCSIQRAQNDTYEAKPVPAADPLTDEYRWV